MENIISDVYKEFNIQEPFQSCEKYGSGHINDTYLIRTSTDKKYILQRINKMIFQNISGLMQNIHLVLDHFDRYRALNNGYELLILMKTRAGNYFWTDPEKQYWRCYNFIDGTVSFNKITNPHLAFEAGCSYGHFQKMLSSLNPDRIVETIPRFHDLELRLEQYDNARIHTDPERLAKAASEMDFAENRRQEFLEFSRLLLSKKFPKRICHNDTKINNILFSKDLHARCVVDLDTVMPGTVLYDFGDAIRTGANISLEDNDHPGFDLLDLHLYEEFTRGYLSKTNSFLTEHEISHLAYSVQFMTFIIGIRFLTDYLAGDKYFKVDKPCHNLIRTHVQFRFLADAIRKREEMEAIVRKWI